MATTFVDYTGDGNATKSFSFPSIKEADIKVDVDGVIKTSGNHYNITSYTTTGGGNVVFTSGNIPASPAAIRIFRDTDVDTAKATFTAGSSVKAGDLNNNMTQILYAAQEEQNQTILTSDIKDAAVTTAKIKDANVTTAKIADSNVTTAKIADANVTTAKIADGAITSPKLAANAVTTGELADTAVTTSKINNDAITSAKIANDQINSEHYVDGSIDAQHIANLNITTGKLADDAVTNAKIADNSIDSEHYVDGSIDTAHYASGSINATAIGNDAIQTAKIADTAVSTAKIADNAITTAKIADSNVITAKLANDAVTEAKLANNAVVAANIQNGAVNSLALATDAVTTDKITNSNVTTAKIADTAISTAKIQDNAVTTGKIADSELKTLAGMQSGTASKLADSTALTADIADLNQIDGLQKATTITDDDTKFPTSGAIVDYVAAQLLPFGGFEAIATELAFPNTQPASGVAISISDAGGVVFGNGSGGTTAGQSLTGRTVGGSTVTINNAPSTLNGETLAAGVGLIVTSTGSGQIYNYHKILGKEADIKQLSDDINDFAERYRVGSSNPTTSLNGGDLFFNTGSGKLLVYNASNTAWEETQSVGNFFINTISSFSGTGGNSATFNGTAYKFNISNAGANAEQHLVSINGVIQKPNSGTSQPSEGFAIDGSAIIFSSAPPSGADYFIITIGASVSIGTPSNNTVTSAILQNGSVTTAKITDSNVTTAKIADDAVTSAKIADDAVVQAAIADASVDEARLQISNSPTNGYFLSAQSGNTGGLTWAAVNTDLSNDTSPQLGGTLDTNGQLISFGDSSSSTVNRLNFGAGNDLNIYHDGNNSNLRDSGTGALILWGSEVRAINSGGSEYLFRAFENGAFEAYYDHQKKFETTSTGATVTGTLTATSFSGDGSNLTGISTDLVNDTSPQLGGDLASNGNDIIFADTDKAIFGNSTDLQIHHAGDNSYIQELGTGSLMIESSGTGIYIQKQGTSNRLADFNVDGDVKLFHNASQKFATTSDGASITGKLSLTADDPTLTFNDSNSTNFRLTANSGYLYFADATNNQTRATMSGSGTWSFNGPLHPGTNNTYDLGSSSKRWANVYTNDLNLSNEGSSNDVDGTWGDWTIQEGESDLFLKNNRSGKKYKFNLTEVS